MPLPDGWNAHQDGEGRTFYTNAAGESSWTLPDDSLIEGWSSHMDPEGRTFYANAMTGESTWSPKGKQKHMPWGPTGASKPSPVEGTTLVMTMFILQLTDMPELATAIGEPHNKQLRERATSVHDAIREGDEDLHHFVSDLVFSTIALPLVSPLVAEAIVAAVAAVASLLEPGVIPGGEASAAAKVLEILEDNAKLIDNLSPYLFSALCRAGVAADSGHSDASTMRTQVALSGACVWLLAAICRVRGFHRFTADALWEWASGDALWLTVLAKGILSLDALILLAPDTPLKGALIPTDLDQLQDAVAGAVLGLIGSNVAFAESVLGTNGVVDEVADPSMKFAKHWAKLAVSVGESGLVVPLLRVAEGCAAGRRPELAGFFAKLLQPELLRDPHWIVSSPSAPIVAEAARFAAASIRESLALHRDRLWVLLATVPSTGRMPRSFLKDCSELAFRSPVPMPEFTNLVRSCLAHCNALATTDTSSLTGLCVFAANAGLEPGISCLAEADDGGLSASLQSLEPNARKQVSSRLAEWAGPVSHREQASWLAFLQETQPPPSPWTDSAIVAPAIPLSPDHCQALGIGGLKELLNGAPTDLCCSLDRLLLTNPVRSPYGHTFEYPVLASALAQNGHVCPVTGQPLSLANCQHDWDVKRRADDHIGRWANTAKY